MGPTGWIKCEQLTSEAGAGHGYRRRRRRLSRNYNPRLAPDGRSLPSGRSPPVRGDARGLSAPTMENVFLGGTAASWRVQSARFSGGRVSCIMHGGCYFHHMLLSGVIVVPALSAQIAQCSQIVVSVSTLTLSPSPLCLLQFVFFFLSLFILWKWSQRAPVGSINWPPSPEWCGSWV